MLKTNYFNQCVFICNLCGLFAKTKYTKLFHVNYINGNNMKGTENGIMSGLISGYFAKVV
jgi:hypothetical protein